MNRRRHIIINDFASIMTRVFIRTTARRILLLFSQPSLLIQILETVSEVVSLKCILLRVHSSRVTRNRLPGAHGTLVYIENTLHPKSIRRTRLPAEKRRDNLFYYSIYIYIWNGQPSGLGKSRHMSMCVSRIFDGLPMSLSTWSRHPTYSLHIDFVRPVVVVC